MGGREGGREGGGETRGIKGYKTWRNLRAHEGRKGRRARGRKGRREGGKKGVRGREREGREEKKVSPRERGGKHLPHKRECITGEEDVITIYICSNTFNLVPLLGLPAVQEGPNLLCPQRQEHPPSLPIAISSCFSPLASVTRSPLYHLQNAHFHLFA
jgi:hypothetical protein